jgi:hypothetical protein
VPVPQKLFLDRLELDNGSAYALARDTPDHASGLVVRRGFCRAS